MVTDKGIDSKAIILDMEVDDEGTSFSSFISPALSAAEKELQQLEANLSETEQRINSLTPDCDKMDYALSASVGALCGIMDIFLAGKPNDSNLQKLTDQWFADRTKDFANVCCPGKKNNILSAAIRHLEEKFKVPYDQTGVGDAGRIIFELNTENHHYKSLAHNPSLLGLFFSILDQFHNTSHFVTVGELIHLEKADEGFSLHGNNVVSKLFCGTVNWLGHLISDRSGSSGGKGRGMGIPSPLWTWVNDVIVIRRKLNIPASDFDRSLNDLAVEIFTEGFDSRFQAVQAIPVIVNECIVRSLYSIRRMIRYYSNVSKDDRSFRLLWESCEPFKNVTVKRMLTVAHGTFCLLDIGDATIRGFIAGGGYFNVVEFCLRLNVAGVGRFAISLYGEVERSVQIYQQKEDAYFIERKRAVVLDYIEGLKALANMYDDRHLLSFVDGFQKSDLYKEAFEKSVMLAEKRNVPEERILKSKAEVDAYFTGGQKEW